MKRDVGQARSGGGRGWARVRTIVVGLPGSGQYADWFAAFARAGEAPLESASDAGYWAVSGGGTAELASTLESIFASSFSYDPAERDPKFMTETLTQAKAELPRRQSRERRIKMHRNALAVSTSALLWLLGCGKAEPRPTPAGHPKEPETKLLEKGAELTQDLSPVRAIDHYLNGFHPMKDHPAHSMEAHHYCKGMNEEFTQCVLFDGNTAQANLIGIEYIISERLFDTLPAEEQNHWHPHNYEILSGQLVMPGVPSLAEKEALRKKMNSYGKTWHLWDTRPENPSRSLPLGKPMLAWSYNHDGEAPPALLKSRDQRAQIDTRKKRVERGELAALARPQRGVDALRSHFPEASSAPPGVMNR